MQGMNTLNEIIWIDNFRNFRIDNSRVLILNRRNDYDCFESKLYFLVEEFLVFESIYCNNLTDFCANTREEFREELIDSYVEK